MVDSVYARLRRLGFFVLQTSAPSSLPFPPRLSRDPTSPSCPFLGRSGATISPPTSLSEPATHPPTHPFSPVVVRSTSRAPAALTSLSPFLPSPTPLILRLICVLHHSAASVSILFYFLLSFFFSFSSLHLRSRLRVLFLPPIFLISLIVRSRVLISELHERSAENE